MHQSLPGAGKMVLGLMPRLTTPLLWHQATSCAGSRAAESVGTSEERRQ